MTRINVGIPVENLLDNHLLSEYREIGRVSTQYKKRIQHNKNFNDIPEEFTLGSGHQTFFLNKGKYIHERFNSLVKELIKRNFKPTLKFRNTWGIDNPFYSDYTPIENDKILIINRIIERIEKQKNQLKYYKKIISINQYIEILKKL